MGNHFQKPVALVLACCAILTSFDLGADRHGDFSLPDPSFNSQALADAVLSNAPQARGILKRSLSFWNLKRRRQAERVPEILLEKYPHYREILIDLCHSALDDETLLHADQTNSQLFEQALRIIDQNSVSFFKALHIFVPTSKSGSSWMIPKFRTTFIIYPTLIASSLQIASSHAATLSHSKYVTNHRVDLAALLEENAVTFVLPTSHGTLTDASRSFMKLADLKDRNVMSSAKGQALAIRFDGDVFSIPSDIFQLIVPLNITKIEEGARLHPDRLKDNRTYEILQFCVKIAIAAAILKQKGNGHTETPSSPLRKIYNSLLLGFLSSGVLSLAFFLASDATALVFRETRFKLIASILSHFPIDKNTEPSRFGRSA